MIQRYDAIMCDMDQLICPCDNGEYVLYDDHAAVLAKRDAQLAAAQARIVELEAQIPVRHDLRKKWDDWPRHTNPVLCKRETEDVVRYSVMHHEDHDWVEVIDDYCIIRYDVIAWQELPWWEVDK